jgi:hypothetical protein
MGTRGLYGFVHKEKEYLTYSHFDSYPGGLGLGLLAWARGVKDWREVAGRVESLTLVDADKEPTPEQAERVRSVTNPGVSTGRDWYSALREAQAISTPPSESGS